ncbi:hypothetical protein WG66_007569 [Moniliophthora roreri]|nr:hypothetical protein WG66_007569 [Moniliophthora roreri]
MWWIASSGLGEDMVEKGIIDRKRLKKFTKVGSGLHPRAPVTLVWALGQPFRLVIRRTRTLYACICVAGEEKLVHLRLNGLLKLREFLDSVVRDAEDDELVLSVYLDHDPRRPLVVRVAEEPPEPYNEWLKKHSPVPHVTVSKKASRQFGDQEVTSSLQDALKILISQKPILQPSWHGLGI